MDIARAYADLRIVELLQAKTVSLRKLKDRKKDKTGRPQSKPRPDTSTPSKGKVQLIYRLTYFLFQHTHLAHVYVLYHIYQWELSLAAVLKESMH